LRVVQFRGRTRRGDDLIQQLADDLLTFAPHADLGCAEGSDEADFLGNRVEGLAAVDRAEGGDGAAARVHPPAQQLRQHRDHQASSVDEIRRQVGARGVATGSAQHDLHDIRGRGDRPYAHANLPAAQLRLAVHRKDLVHTTQGAGRDDVLGPTVQDLFGGLDDTAHPTTLYRL